MRDIGTITARKAGLKCTWCNFEPQKRKRFCRFEKCLCIHGAISSYKNPSVFASLLLFVLTFCLFKLQKPQVVFASINISANMVSFRASQTARGVSCVVVK